jgi:hypothetical protein
MLRLRMNQTFRIQVLKRVRQQNAKGTGTRPYFQEVILLILVESRRHISVPRSEVDGRFLCERCDNERLVDTVVV